MSKQIKLTVFTLALATTACSTTPTDNTPTQNTAVIQAKATMDGLYAPNATVTQTVYTRADQRRIDEVYDYDSFLMSWADQDTSTIARIDQKLRWELNNDKKQYRECELAGCMSGTIDQLLEIPEDAESEQEAGETYEELDCPMTLVSNNLTVDETGKTRIIGGEQAREFTAQWKAIAADSQGKQDTNIINFVFWTTKPTTTMQQVWQTHDAFQSRYIQHTHDQNLLAQAVGEDGYKMLARFLGDMDSSSDGEYTGALAPLQAIEGYPLSIKFEWFRDAQACQQQRGGGTQESADNLEDMAKNMVAGFLNKKKDAIVDKWKKDALIRYIYEVESVSVEPIHDSKFSVPEKYKLIDRQ